MNDTVLDEWATHTAIKGSVFSIKNVLPALLPNRPELNYETLEGVKKGTDAVTAFLSLKNLPQEERDKLRKSLLEYCRLDTLAMVEIYKELCLLAEYRASG